jgi:hypothetical protein
MPTAKPSPGFFPSFLLFVFVLFIGILAASWYFAKQANPVILDEKGLVRHDAGHH